MYIHNLKSTHLKYYSAVKITFPTPSPVTFLHSKNTLMPPSATSPVSRQFLPALYHPVSDLMRDPVGCLYSGGYLYSGGLNILVCYLYSGRLSLLCWAVFIMLAMHFLCVIFVLVGHLYSGGLPIVCHYFHVGSLLK